MKHETALPAPFHAELADAPPGATVVWAQAGTARIRLAWWKAGDRGTVLLLPGRTECIEKYGLTYCDAPILTFECKPLPEDKQISTAIHPKIYPNLFNKV